MGERFKNGLLSENRLTVFDESEQTYHFGDPDMAADTAIHFIGTYEDEVENLFAAVPPHLSIRSRYTAWSRAKNSYVLVNDVESEKILSLLAERLGQLEDAVLKIHSESSSLPYKRLDAENIEEIKAIFKESGYKNYEFSDAVYLDKESRTYAIMAKYIHSSSDDPQYAMFIYSPSAEYTYKSAKFGLSKEAAADLLIETVKNYKNSSAAQASDSYFHRTIRR